MPRYLTKSRFKLALGCPAKLFYTGKEQYPDISQENEFLEALAEGGYQVGALATCYYPGGIGITERGYDIPLQRTNELLQQENVVIFEAAFLFQNLFIRADIIEKKGNKIRLIEVKAKSFGGNDSSDMLGKKGLIEKGWRDYLYDVAFQKYVITKAFPQYEVSAYLMLADKNKVATVDGLNQKFQLKTVNDGLKEIEVVGEVTKEALGEEILVRVNVDDLLEKIYNGTDQAEPPAMSFTDLVHHFADHYQRDQKIVTPIHKDCKDCEYRATPEEEALGKRSGFKECWSAQLGWTDQEFAQPQMLDIWNYRKKEKRIEEGKILMRDLSPADIGKIKPREDGTLSSAERQWMQVQKLTSGDNEPYVDLEGLKAEMDRFVFPLHFIDFETSMVAIPFFMGRKPYEQVAFQFSHHVVYDDLRIEHKGQYLCREKGAFPNFEFVRALKAELENDNGTIFRYAAHENTVLNQILKQLQEATKTHVPDKNELIDFIRSISTVAKQSGPRNMVDLRELVVHYYYHPLMGGSNSIKAVLPAVLASSECIQQKYAQPIYGKNALIKSLNFDDNWIWIKKDDTGRIISPYKLLPPIFEGLEDEQIEACLMQIDIKDGGAAMTAYAKMQFMSMTPEENELVAQGLLKYCELDTLAMVMIWEYWRELKNK